MTEYSLGGRAVRVDVVAVLFAIEEQALTRTAVADQCHVSERTLRRFLLGNKVSARTMDRIISGLGLEASDIITYLKTGGKHGKD
jgi:hypothetical protein